MATVHDPDLQLTGETVSVSYVADPSLGRGQFRLENREALAVTASVEDAWLELGAQRQTLTGVTVFDLEQERMLNPEGFEVGAGQTLKFLLGFPVIAYEPRFGESTSVGLRLRADGVELQALSPVEFTRRFPRAP